MIKLRILNKQITNQISNFQTPQTCVKECPSLTTSFYSKAKLAENVLSEMRPYCFPMTDQKFQSMTSRQLIESGLCPAWVRFEFDNTLF